MKEIVIGYIMVAFIVSLMIGSALCVVIERTNSVARIATERRDFDDYVFVAPDGERYRAHDWFPD